MLTTQIQRPGPDRANKLYVHTRYASDGRSLEGAWLTYDPSDAYALMLLEFALNLSDGVDHYSVFGTDGVKVSEFNPARHPKRR